MRLLALELKAYGPFTDKTLDFSSHPGLCLVYGPNEAGKSTALRALTSLLYGIEAQTTDGFLHKYGDLRVGGRLQHSDGSVLHVLRRKGNKNTLLGVDGKPVEDARLEPFLAGVSRELFRTLFGIDHEHLRQGGEDMLKGGGEVRQALFSASTGFVGLTELGQRLEDEAGALFKPRGQLQTLNQLTRKYQELKKAREESVLRGADWKRHQEALRQAMEKREAMVRRRQEKAVELARLQRLQRSLPLVTRREGLRRELQTLADAMLLPAGFTERRTSAYELLRSKELDAGRLEQELERIARELDSLAPQPRLLERAEEVKRLHRDSGQYLKGRADLPNLKGRLSTAEWEARTLLKELRPDLSLEEASVQLRLPRGKRDRIRELGNLYQARVEQPRVAARSLQALELELERKRKALAELPAPREAGALRRVLEQVQRKGDLEGTLAERRRVLVAEEKQAAVEQGRLGLWQGELEVLERLAVPSVETVQRFEAEQGRLGLKAEQLERERRQVEVQAAEAERDLEALRRAGEVPTEEELAAARAQRDKAWGVVRKVWLEGASGEVAEAEAFEKRMQEADGVADRLRREAARVERQATLRAAVERHGRERARLTEEQQKLARQREELGAEWKALWGKAGIEPLPPVEMRAWLGRHQALVERARKLRELRQQVQELEGEIGRYREEVGRELVALGAAKPGPKEPLEALLMRGRTLVQQVAEETQKREALREALAELEQKVLLARREVEQAERALQEWRQEWGEAVAVLGLSASDHPNQANASLQQLEELFKHLENAAVFRSRIHGIERDAEHFTQEVGALCEQVAAELVGLPPDVASSRLHERWQEASQQAAKRDSLVAAREEKRAELERTRREREQAATLLQGLLREAGCERYEALREVEERSARRRKAEEGLAACEQELWALSGGKPLEAFAAEVAAVDADRLPGLLERLEAELRELEEEQSKLDQEIGNEQSELRRMDGSSRAGELAEEAQGLLAAIRVHSERYLLLKLAGGLLQQQMEEWRKRNQNPLLDRAASLFASLTLGGFSGLEAGYDEKDEQVLFGIRANGVKVRVEGMSEGTRDQLFLALRLASLEQFLERNEPLPLVIDDILINFDDERSAATLKALVELAKRTQVLFFTHHAHLLGLARKSLPKGSFHVLELERN